LIDVFLKARVYPFHKDLSGLWEWALRTASVTKKETPIMTYTHYHWRHTDNAGAVLEGDDTFTGGELSELDALRMVNAWNHVNPEYWMYWV
jgi:hypothetical protein